MLKENVLRQWNLSDTVDNLEKNPREQDSGVSE